MNVSHFKRLAYWWRRLFLAALLTVVSFTLCVKPVYAAIDPGVAISVASFAYDVISKYLDSGSSDAEKATALSAYKDHWSTVLTEHYSDISFDALSEAVLSLNDAGQPARIVAIDGGYVIVASGPFGLYHFSTGSGFGSGSIWNNTGQYFGTTNGYIFRATYNTDSLLSSLYASAEMIRVNLQNLYNQQATHFANIAKQLTNFQTLIDADISNLSAKLKTIVDQTTKINTQFRDFVNGHTVDDLIGAIENISGGDHSGIVSLLGQIDGHLTAGLTAVKSAIEGITIPAHPSYDDTSLRALVSSIDKKLDELPGGSVTADLQPVVDAVDRLNENVSLISTLSVHKLFGVSVVPATSGLRYRDGVFTYWVTPDPILTMTALDWSFDSIGDTNGESGEIELPFETTGITLSFSDPALLENGFYGCLATSDGELLEVDSGSFTEHNGKYLYTFSDLHLPSSATLTIDSGNMELLAKDLSISAAHIVGHNGSTDKVAFYADGAYYDIPLMAADGSPCLMQAAIFNEGYGTDYQSTLTRDADGVWHLTVGNEPDKLLSADCGAKLDAALTWNKDYTWFSWFYGYSASFQGWLSDQLGSLHFGGETDLSTVTSRLDTIIKELQSSSGDTACSHTYQQEATQEATCILPGLLVSTCTKCGESYSEIVAALGHDWKCTDHVEAVKDAETGEVLQSGYDIYTCSRCGDSYKDYSGSGAPEDDYGDSSISKLVVRLFSKLGTLAGKLISSIIHLFDKLLSGVDQIITRFNELTAQITGFGGEYPSWLSGFWGILPQELQLALSFAVLCMALGLVGKKLLFT